ncbi:MAG: hypothetical protein KDD84_15225 [Caldilineaceae bacterium]|nr:hypothetical protein [Caldilineaceae bacterium]
MTEEKHNVTDEVTEEVVEALESVPAIEQAVEEPAGSAPEAVAEEATSGEVEEAVATPEPVAVTPTPAVAEPVAAEAPARPRRQFQPQPDTGKKIGPFSASMWLLILSVVAFFFALISLLF